MFSGHYLRKNIENCLKKKKKKKNCVTIHVSDKRLPETKEMMKH